MICIAVLPLHLSTVGRWAFPVSGVHTWNDFPYHVTSAPSLTVLRHHLKTVLFCHSYPDFLLWLRCPSTPSVKLVIINIIQATLKYYSMIVITADPICSSRSRTIADSGSDKAVSRQRLCWRCWHCRHFNSDGSLLCARLWCQHQHGHCARY